MKKQYKYLLLVLVVVVLIMIGKMRNTILEKMDLPKIVIKDSIVLYNNGSMFCEGKFSVSEWEKIGVWKYYNLDNRLNYTKEYLGDTLIKSKFSNGILTEEITTIYDKHEELFSEEEHENEYGQTANSREYFEVNHYKIVEKYFYENGELKSERRYNYTKIDDDNTALKVWDSNGELMLDLINDNLN